ncbi:hypothetical protein V5P93_005873 [Actinokineospora auranticolor]|uniref:hypothetical protein n=1 Tax=Actinokineospora auranticolor TaxID=155976 RepID=UPI0015E40DB6|nr:hypothetical protein [Actinokineospora auranticolor]
MATTWKVAIDGLPPSARKLRKLLAFFAAEDIPVGRVFRLEGPLTDPLERQRAINALRAVHLIMRTKEGRDAVVSIHPLVQAVTREDLGTERARWARAGHDLIAATALTGERCTPMFALYWATYRPATPDLPDAPSAGTVDRHRGGPGRRACHAEGTAPSGTPHVRSRWAATRDRQLDR